MRRDVVILLAIIFLVPNLTDAGQLAYKCEILSELKLSANGTLRTEAGYDFYIGKVFHVDRKSGVLLGANLTNSGYEKIDVLDPGSDEMSFKVVWMSAIVGNTGGRNVRYLEVREFEKKFEKPFILVTSGTVLTGTCE